MLGSSLILLASFLPQTQPAEQPTAVPALRIAIDGPVYTGEPIWIRVSDAGPRQAIRYPFGSSAGDFGCNRLEVKRNGTLLIPRNFPRQPQAGIACGSAAPHGSPENRLPLHVPYPITEAGIYSVRWIQEYPSIEDGQLHMRTTAQSEWLTFTVLAATPQQHEAWLKNLLANPPDDGQLAGDFLPSLITAGPDPRALNEFIKYLYADDGVVSGIADSALQIFPQPDVLRAVAASLEENGPSEELAYFATYHTGWTLDDQDKIVHAAIPYLQHRYSVLLPEKGRPPFAPTRTSAALKLLGFIFYVPNHAWPSNPELRSYADAQVLEAALDIVASGSLPAVHELAIYLGEMKASPSAHQLLLQIAKRSDDAGEQARICLTWHPQPAP